MRFVTIILSTRRNAAHHSYVKIPRQPTRRAIPSTRTNFRGQPESNRLQFSVKISFATVSRQLNSRLVNNYEYTSILYNSLLQYVHVCWRICILGTYSSHIASTIRFSFLPPTNISSSTTRVIRNRHTSTGKTRLYKVVHKRSHRWKNVDGATARRMHRRITRICGYKKHGGTKLEKIETNRRIG